MGFPSHYNGLVFHSPSLVKTFEKVAQPIPQDWVCATADLQEWCPMAVSSTRRCTPVHRAVEKRTSININTPRWGFDVWQPTILNTTLVHTNTNCQHKTNNFINMRLGAAIAGLHNKKGNAHILRSTHAQTDCVAPSKPFNAARFPA